MIPPVDVDDSKGKSVVFSATGVNWGRFFSRSLIVSRACVLSRKPSKPACFPVFPPLPPVVPHFPQSSGEVRVHRDSPLRNPLVPRVTGGEKVSPSRFPQCAAQKRADWETKRSHL